MKRRAFLTTSARCLGASPLPRDLASRPNILFIMVDEMRWDAMRCEKHPVVETPNLDRLAREGVRFARSYTVSPVCSPARASAFTGRYAHTHGVTTNEAPAYRGEIFLPSILKHYGYDTAISGKLHFTPARFDYGFDRFWSYMAEGPTPELGYSAYLKQKYGAPAKWPKMPGTCPWPEDPLGRDVGVFRYPIEDFETEWITDRAVDYLRSRRAAGRPWFLFASYLKPHSPSVEPQPWFGRYDPAKIPVPKLPLNAREIRAARTGQSKRFFVDDERMVRAMSAIYYGSVAHVDNQVGRLLGELDKLGMAGNTLVLFTADHGNMLGDRGRWFKAVQYEGSARVPLLWKGPKGSPENGGRAVEQVVENTDLLPSILEAAGIPVPEGVQGRSFLKLARGREPDWKNRCYSQLQSGMLVDGQWKLIENSLDGSGALELYHLRNDPKEERNLAADRKLHDRIVAYRRRLAAWRAERPAPVRILGMPAPVYAQTCEAAPGGAEPPRQSPRPV